MIGVLAAAAVLLGAAGIGKIRRPGPTGLALRAVRLPGATVLGTRWLVQLFGATEVVIAFGVMAFGGRLPALALALAYLVLALVARRMVRVAPGQDCGCFGKAQEPISQWHTRVNSVCVLIGLIAVLWPQPSLIQELGSSPATAPVLMAFIVLLSWLAYLSMTVLPELTTARRKVELPR